MKPILFNIEMVRAILDGRKSVARRVVKPQPHSVMQGSDSKCWCGHFVSAGGKVLVDKPPYRCGDTLYVRETWTINNITPHDPEWSFKADYDCSVKPYCNWKWHPSIHMPKEAARLFLRVAGVRVERLQNISEEDSILEGIERRTVPVINASDISEYRIPGTKNVCISGRGAFSHLWDSTIKKADLHRYGWTANPWVWVIEFERISKEEAKKGGERNG